MSIVQTYTGQRVDLLDPKPENINITDIAHQLSLINRFTGATGEAYSVAQHSVFVAAEAQREASSLTLAALLHDAHEAYIGDISHPLKRAITGALDRHGFDVNPLGAIANRLNDAIARRFGFQYDQFYTRGIKQADLVALATERRDLMTPDPASWPILDGIEPHPEPIRPLPARDAEQLFLDTFASLC